jgi:hypothetical protein
MADTLYLSLWYPNLRLAGLAEKLTAVLGAFAKHGGEARVYSATVWPVGWSESPVFQKVFGHGERGLEPRQAVEDALELLHEDYAYEFQIGWSLWEAEIGGETGLSTSVRSAQIAGEAGPWAPLRSAQDDGESGKDDGEGWKTRWARESRLVSVTGYGPLFDEGAYEQDGHIRINFGSDAASLDEEIELDSTAAHKVEENVRQLIDLTTAAEKDSGATARLLWSELGESLAQRLAARLGMTN